MKKYIGDSVYVEYVENEAISGIVITSENKGEVNQSIFIEDPIIANLLDFLSEIRVSFGAKPIIYK